MSENPNTPDPTRPEPQAVPPKKRPTDDEAPLDLSDIAGVEGEPEGTLSSAPPPPAIAPVSPATGWLDPDEPMTLLDPHLGPTAPPDEGEPTDLIDVPPIPDGSDIFSGGPVPPALPVESSDVIAATLGEATPADELVPPGPGSDSALSFNRPPRDSTVGSGSNSSDLPVADEVADSFSGLLNSARLAGTPHVPDRDDDTPSYGKVPDLTPDASSILADLAGSSRPPAGDSSIRVESPGMPRTLSSNPSTSTEFDLNVHEGDVPPELEEAAAAASENEWRPPSEPDIFINSKSAAEINLGTRAAGDDSDSDSGLSESGSSIFSGSKTPVPAGAGGSSQLPLATPSEEDISVEFSDHPTTEPEASGAALYGSNPQPVRRPTPQPDSQADFGALPEPGVDDSDEGLGALPPGVLDSPSSAILSGRGADKQTPTRPSPFDTADTRTPPRGKPLKAPSNVDKASDPSVEIDWMAGSSSEVPVVRHEARSTEATPARAPTEAAPTPLRAERRERERSTPDRERPVRSAAQGGWIGGTVLGMVIAGGTWAGLYFSGTIPNSEKPTQIPIQQAPLIGPPVAAGGGEPAGGQPGPQPGTPAIVAQARLMARIQELAKNNTPVAADDAELKKAREELQAVADDVAGKGEKAAVEATIYLGVSHEIAGDRAAAKQVYEAGRARFPRFAATFDAALDRLAATAPTNGTSRRLTPADVEQLLLTVVLLQSATADEPEAGTYFWKAVKLANAGNYTEAIHEIGKAKAAHVKQAKAMAGRGLNPLSDPLEQIFPRACDDLKAYWELRAAIYTNKGIAEAIKRDGAEKVIKDLADAQMKAAAAVKLMTELAEANTKLAKAQSDFTDANTKLAKAQIDLKAATDKVTRAETDLKAAMNEYTKKEKLAADTLAKAQKEIDLLKGQVTKAETDRKAAADVVSSLAKELQAIKLLPAEYDTAALLSAQRAAMQRATGPTLSALIPSGMAALGGGGLTAGQLLDVAERLTKAETAAKAAADKLTAETRRLEAEHATEIKKLKDSHAAEVKKLTDNYAAEVKKLTDSYTAGTSKLKDDHAAELKKLTDKFAADMKKQGDDHTAALKKLTDGYDAKIKGLEATVAQQKVEAEALAAKFKTDLGNALTPTTALDIWLPLLADLRRPADAAAALATAQKVLATAPRDSEDAAKARTVAGWAHLLTNRLPQAREMFSAARSSPAYTAATGKPWVKAADTGLATLDDPLASYRVPVPVGTHDPVGAIRFLDAGIGAYKAQRYADAVEALVEATKRDAANPLAWYYLGAARWATGDTQKAKDDFAQAAEREKLSPISSRTLNDALAPIQGAARNALNLVRP